MPAQAAVVRHLVAGRVALASTLVAALLLSMLAVAPRANAEVLPQPTLLGSIDPDSPLLRWQPVAGATKYKVEMSANADYSSPYYNVSTDNLQATPFKDAPVGTTYYRVRAIDATNTTGAPTEGTFVRSIQQVVDGIDASSAVSPADGATVDYPTPIVLRWPWVARMYSYTVQIDDNSSFTSPSSYPNVQGTSLALQTTPAFGTTQYWRVKGISDTGAETSWSGPWSYVQQWPTSAAVPTSLSPANDPDGTSPLNDVRLSWAPVTGAEKYEVQVSLSSDFNDPSRSIFNGTVLSASWSPQPALAAASYYWRVRAVAVGDRKLTNGWTSTRQFRRSWGPEEGNPVPPVSPDDASANAYPVPMLTSSSGTVARDDFRLEWAPVRRAGAYVVQISSNKNFPMPVPSGQQTITCTTYRTVLTANRAGTGVEDLAFPVDTVESNTNTLTNSASCDKIDALGASSTSGLVNGVPYYWRVMAVDTSSTARRANDPNIVMTPWSSNQEDPLNPPSFTLDGTVHTAPTAGPGVTLVSPANGVQVADAPELVWSPVTGYSLYRVQTALDAGFTNMQSIQYSTSTRLIPAGSMKDNDTSGSYYWRVQACDSPGNCQPTSEVRQFKKRNKIVDQHPVDRTTDEIRFSWDTLSQTPGSAGVVRGYRIEISTNPDFTVTTDVVESATVDVPFYSSPTKHFGVGQYYWRVVPVDDWKRELASTPTDLDNPDQTWKFAVTTAAPTATLPSVGPPVSVVPSAPTLTWTSSEFVSGYQVEIYKGANLSGAVESSSGTLTSAAYTPHLKKFQPGLYSWRVRKIGPGGSLGSWNTDSLPTPPTFSVGASEPSGLLPADGAVLDPAQRLLRWDPVRGAVSYRVKLTGTGLTETTVTAYTAQAPVGVLTAGTTYSWTVAAVNTAGDTLSESPARTFTVRTVPSVPRTPVAATSGTTLNLSWTAPANDGGSAGTGYRVRYRVFGSSDAWTQLDRPAGTGSVAILGLPTSTKFEAQVAALNAVGQGPWSTLVSATTATTPGTPTGLRVTAGAGSLSVSWAKPSDGGSPITGYLLRYTPSGGSTTTLNPTTTSAVLSGLTPGVGYSVDVAAVNAVGTGSFASAVQGTPTTGSTPTPTTTTTPKPPAGSTATTLTVAGGRTVVSGAGATLSGKLTTSAGAAVSGRTVTVQSRPVGGSTWATVGTASTASTGAWSSTVKPKVNTEYRATFAASSPYQASTSGTATVLVAPKITRKLSASTVKLGAKVTFTGTVAPAHKAKTVYLQFLKAGKWVTKKSATTSSTSTYRISLKAGSRKDFAWRVYLPKHADHAAGYSAKIVLTVK